MIDVGDEQIGVVAELVGDVPHRNLMANVANVVDYGPKARGFGDRERQQIVGVRVKNRHHVRTLFVDSAVDEALQIERARLGLRGRSIHIVGDNVACPHQAGAARDGEEKFCRVRGVAQADMAIGVEHFLMRQNAVCDHDVAPGALDQVHCLFPKLF